MLQRSKVKYIQSLRHKKFRDAGDVFIVEGPRMAKELLECKVSHLLEIFATEAWILSNAAGLKGVESDKLHRVTDAELGSLSSQQSPSQVLAVVRKFGPEQEPRAGGHVTLALDDIQDPGNMGTIIRTADWFGLTQVVCSRNCADIWNPKVVQATMGSIFRVDVHYVDLAGWIGGLRDMPVLTTALDGNDLFACGPLQEGVIIIGNEGRGVSDALMKLSDKKITIPRYGHAESLNAAVAAGIILGQMCRR
jgi:TrmH family RNA methyltransferase